jgi:ATP-dependent Clp protease protease subunit
MLFKGIQLTNQDSHSFQTIIRKKINFLASNSLNTKEITKCPIGIPKVPFRNSKERFWQWIEIWDVMYRERIIFMGQPLKEDTGNNLVATLLYLDSLNNNDIKNYINCSGGDVTPCLAIFDSMRHVKSDIVSLGFGSCMGMAGFLLSMGHKGKRFALQNTRLMLHHPTGLVRGQASEIYREACEIMKIRNRIDQLIAEQSGQPVEKVAYDLRRNIFMTAENAIDYGIIDTVIKPKKEKLYF